MKLSAIEIGTNSTKFIIVESDGAGTFVVKEKSSTVNRLSKNMYGGNSICEEAIENTINILKDYIARSHEQSSKIVSIFSTSVLRDAANKDTFIKKVKDLFGIDVDVISGEKEAFYAYKACSRLVHDQKEFAVIDIGGGSTEIITGDKNSIRSKASVDIGAVRLTEMFAKSDPMKAEEIAGIKEYIINALRNTEGTSIDNMCLIGTGGTVKTIGTIFKNEDYENEQAVDSAVIKKEDIENIFHKLSGLHIEERRETKGLNPKRADVIAAGLIILIQIMQYYGINEVTVSSQGVLEGFMESYLFSLNI